MLIRLDASSNSLTKNLPWMRILYEEEFDKLVIIAKSQSFNSVIGTCFFLIIYEFKKFNVSFVNVVFKWIYMVVSMLPFDRYFITSKVKTFRFVIISVYFYLINQVTR